ncbi:monofunctional biosynthetic peptidoglycan transglycosylase [Serratia marcescens]|uniref:Monofunctional biosynthetic peptidoglycan transglycosylase n=1 Tax=Serratia marcescens TaxID=615 RepID=A0A379YG49_SERMA|nr:monofunctional biosynthetic peptidoglycan transglycosylase [Serratia marcescens]
MRKSLVGWRRLRPWYWLKRGVIAIIGLWVLGIVLFAFLPVPFSAVMVERQVSAWLSGDFGYVAHSDWVSMDDISPQMALAVMAGGRSEVSRPLGLRRGGH